MSRKSVIEKFWEINPDSEIWWDSSLVIYDNWRKKMIDRASDKEEMQEWLDRLYYVSESVFPPWGEVEASFRG